MDADSGRHSSKFSALEGQRRLVKLQKQTAANTTAAANANAKADAKVNVASANTAYPLNGPAAPSDVVVKMPNNRPTICTADDQNCNSSFCRQRQDAGQMAERFCGRRLRR
jgi:phosphate-selective porin OprO/OprP